MTELAKTIHEQDARREAPELLATGGSEDRGRGCSTLLTLPYSAGVLAGRLSGP